MIKNVFIFLLVGLVSSTLFSETEQKSVTSDKIVDVAAHSSLMSNSKQLTFVGPRSGEGYFSKDGRKMIFQAERETHNPFYQMFVLDLGTGKVERLSPGLGMTTCGWIHPNMKKAMWSSTHLDKGISEKVKTELDERSKPVKKRYSWSYDDQYDIFESDLHGQHIKQLTKELGYDAEGSYSPNGKLIAFASNRSQYSDSFSEDEKKLIAHDPSYAMEIYTMSANGTDLKRLTRSAGYDGGPFFSADGKKITWRRFTPDGSRAEIFTMNTDGSEQKPVTNLGALSWAPFFHPSGKYIIFASSVLGYSNFELFIVDSEGKSKPIRVSFAEGFDGLATFSPDGKKVTWTHRNEKGESQIYLADWDHQKALDLLKEITPEEIRLKLTDNSDENLRSIVKYLASEQFEGRFTGSPKEMVYTSEIARVFKELGLKPAVGQKFIQEFEFTSTVTATEEKNSLAFKGRLEMNLKRNEDYQILSYSKSGEFPAGPVIFAGYGIKAPATEKMGGYDSYKNLDVAGKWVVILDHMPDFANRDMKQHLLIYSRPQHKVTVAKNLKAAGIIFVSDIGLKELKFEGSLSDSNLPVLKISTKAFSKVIESAKGAFKNYKELETAFAAEKQTEGFLLNSQYLEAKVNLNHIKSTGHNVIGYLPAGSKNAKAILLGAHGDHLGRGEVAGSSLARSDEKDKVHYGADDNASGVAGVLELARYFSSHRKTLKKPLYFAVWSGEEIGVLGSNYFTKQWKLEKNKEIADSFEASLNMDMIGRLKDKLQVQGVASAKQWASLSEEVSLVTGLSLTLTSDPYLPTDAISFYLANIPFVSFFSGTHEDYHSPRDRYELINFSGLSKSVDVVKSFTQKLAEIDSPVVTYEKVEGNNGGRLEGRSFRIYLGTIPDYSQEGVKGVRLSGASKNSPAEKAGLQSGDIIVSFDNTKIENLYDYVYALQSAKPNTKIKLNILRNGAALELEITPSLKE